jgi:hypothetical protein
MTKNNDFDTNSSKFLLRRLSEIKIPILKNIKYFNVPENTDNGNGNRKYAMPMIMDMPSHLCFKIPYNNMLNKLIKNNANKNQNWARGTNKQVKRLLNSSWPFVKFDNIISIPVCNKDQII